ncbi:MAG: hypothetical protein ABFD90_17185 [Phycisphaerales bacterium]
MVLTKRERILAIVTVLVLGTLAINSAIIKPLSTWRQETEDEKLELEAQIQEAQNLFEHRRLLERKWRGLLSEGMKSDADAESRIARALTEWARQTRLTLSSVKPDRAITEKGMNEITFAVAGEGTLDAVTSFLYRVETAELPVKVTNMSLGSSNESGENMSLQLRLSAVYLGSVQKTSEPTPQQPSEADNEDALL